MQAGAWLVERARLRRGLSSRVWRKRATDTTRTIGVYVRCQDKGVGVANGCGLVIGRPRRSTAACKRAQGRLIETRGDVLSTHSPMEGALAASMDVGCQDCVSRKEEWGVFLEGRQNHDDRQVQPCAGPRLK